MGQSIAAILINANKLKLEMTKFIAPKENQIPVIDFVDKVLPKCGKMRYFGDNKEAYCLLVHADAWEEYDAYFTLMNVIERYHGIENGYEMVSEAVEVREDDGAETYEVFEEALGIEYDDVPKHPYDEEEDE